MVELIVIGFVAGVVAGISPCILPVLPVILAAGATGSGAPGAAPPSRSRSVAIVAGLVVSFSFVILAGSEVLTLLHLPQDLLRDLGIAMLVLVGLGLLVPAITAAIDRPFARIRGRQPRGTSSGFVVGLALGTLFVPCAGPVLAAITVVGATHRVSLTAVVLTVAFGVGAAVPLLAVALAGSGLATRVAALRVRGPRIRQVSGVVLIGMALAIGFNLFTALQRDVPGYTSVLQTHIEGSKKVREQLSALTGNSHSTLANCDAGTSGLVNCGPAPAFTGITTWLNTPGGRPLTLSGLRGKVVLVDFWTYSCINCQRTLPHVEAWYRDYAKDGLVVVGVHTPEFAFEHVVSNIRSESAALGVHYPIAVDNDYGTWDAYDNEYWPAEYLIDASGDVRHEDFGEGQYSTTEDLIRELLVDAHPGLRLPPPTDVANRTPTGEISPETYVGYDRLQYLLPSPRVPEDVAATYHFPRSLPLGGLGLSGRWTDNAQEATADADSRLELAFLAKEVYLVIGGSGTVRETVDGGAPRTIRIGGIPRLYTLVSLPSTESGLLRLDVSPGVQVYDFTFG